MSKIIADPDRIISALTKSFGEHNRHAIAAMFSNYISDAVIAVTAEDIIEQAIAWICSYEDDFSDHYTDIDINDDAGRYAFVQERLIENLEI
jgi:hypothetical protein